MRPASNVIRGVLQSEKGTRLAAAGQYLLRVASDANKVEIRHAAQELFGVKILKVNTQIGHGKWRRIQARWGRRSDLKKAIVTVAKGQKIEVKS
jgi:large subunit ribosomal protein L23